MKQLLTFLLIGLTLLSVESIAQSGKKALSPKETVTGSIDGAAIEIVYCRPSARGRKMIGGVEPLGKVWRTGANDATTIEFKKAVVIEGKELAAGKYALFTIPNENEWVIIFNKKTDQWGAYDYEKHKDQDALRVTVKPTKAKEFIETFTIAIDKNAINLSWENTIVAFKVKG
jgi:hypothetical protein